MIPPPKKSSQAQFRKHTEDSLKRLGVEHFARLTNLLRQGEVFDWLRTLKADKRERFLNPICRESILPYEKKD